MKKILTLALCLLMALCLTACGGNDDATQPDAGNDAVAVDLAACLEQIKTDCALTDARNINADSLFDIYGVAAEQYKQAACCMVPTGVFPAEVLMFEAVDADAAAAIAGKLELRLQEVKNQSQSYDAENYALAQQCAVNTNGNIVTLFISADFNAMNDILDTYIK
ncbi:MAG: DUF4358 domain-containing protein [Ruminococcaceae bacterium]|nr:DUF4358 domain-containing protein [Oscillospiraceae bacterium]